MSLIEQLESKKKIEYFDVTLASEEIQPVSEDMIHQEFIETKPREANKTCSICKKKFELEQDWEEHMKIFT